MRLVSGRDQLGDHLGGRYTGGWVGGDMMRGDGRMGTRQGIMSACGWPIFSIDNIMLLE